MSERSPRTPRARRDPASPDDAATMFQERTGVDPRTDAVVVQAAYRAGLAEVMRVLRRQADWYRAIFALLRGAGEPPALHEGVAHLLGRGDPAQATLVMTFGKAAGVAPGEQVDLAQLVRRGHALGVALHENLVATRRALKELEAQQVDERGRRGRMLEPQPPNRAPSDPRKRFVWALRRGWAAAKRPELDATSIALAAAAMRLEEIDDWANVVERWRVFLRRQRGQK